MSNVFDISTGNPLPVVDPTEPEEIAVEGPLTPREQRIFALGYGKGWEEAIDSEESAFARLTEIQRAFDEIQRRQRTHLSAVR